jgi:hypothetical protein
VNRSIVGGVPVVGVMGFIGYALSNVVDRLERASSVQGLPIQAIGERCRGVSPTVRQKKPERD